MVVEIKHEKLGDKLRTDTSSLKNLHKDTRPSKLKICVEARLFTVNESNVPSHQSKQRTQTWFHMSKVPH